MASLNKIQLEIEPITKLYCINTACVYNLNHFPSKLGPYCNMKYIDLDEHGVCRDKRTDEDFKELK